MKRDTLYILLACVARTRANALVSVLTPPLTYLTISNLAPPCPSCHTVTASSSCTYL